MGPAIVLTLPGQPPDGLREVWGGRPLPPGPLGLSLTGPGGPAALAAVVAALGDAGAVVEEAHYRAQVGPGYEVRVWSGLSHLTASAFVVRAERVLLLRHRTKGIWLPPGGHVEPHEQPADAAVREVWEETGIEARAADPAPFDLQVVEVAPGHRHIDLVFQALVIGGRAVPGREADALRWFTAEELDEPGVPANVASGARRALALAREAGE